ncbi:MAG: CoA-acylating methylmalonate-semialdehyde dehydrogenase [Candidatus Eisenbacteria bacterium]|uniref:methylmalonate-semialdehyde dehydrogenase (CoA acylating) n=1 Tax=Eiseniibacteriota bacterium TaxID=2212470 RepID=A0A538U7D7_UNCEI|nr:MAG: CoA-acylating methylmalonate-semialdehyde dehydrogenase [Candidatus Eisenbacteria bacterium]
MSAHPAPATLAANRPKTSPRTLQNFIGGRWVDSPATSFGEIRNPATGDLLARVPLGGRADVDAAVAAAARAFPAWRATPPVNRVRVLFTLRELLERHFDDLATIVTLEHGKTLDESRSSIRRAIDNVEVACAIPTTMQGRALEDIAHGIDCSTYRQPLGVFAAITPFNFPAMVPMWFLPHAIACGNTFNVKPSERVPLSQVRMFELMHEAGMPEGVVNLVHGAKDATDAILDHPGIAGVSFVGSSPVARHVYERAAQTGKRVQALGGAKNFVLVMPDADMTRAAQVSTESCFGCAGERCLANSVVLGVGRAYDEMSKRLVDAARGIRIGNGLEPGVTMGPVISEAHREKILSYIAKGVAEGATLALDGRGYEDPKHPTGYFLAPTVFTDVRPEMTIAREEIFGPVLCVMKADTFEEAVAIVKRHELGNATSIFTSSGKAAREYRWHVEPSMLGVNIGVAAPMAFFPFGGAKGSFFGDLKAHGQDAVEFYTDKKVTITRWF